MTRAPLYTRLVLITALVAIVPLAGGCTALTINGSADALPEAPSPSSEQASLQAQQAQSITVEIRPDRKKVEITSLTLEPGMTLQQSLEKVGVTKRFRRMDIDVMRMAGGERQKLEAKYDHAHDSVNPLYDYAIYPGDHLVIVEDPSTALDDMLNAVLVPLGINGKR